MKVELKVSNAVTITAEGESQLDVFKNLASMQEIFGEKKCGKCHGVDLVFRVRNVKDGKKEYEYPELHCSNKDCRAKLSYGQMEGGSLFPVRYERKDSENVKDKDGKNIVVGSWGWKRYNKETGKEE